MLLLQKLKRSTRVPFFYISISLLIFSCSNQTKKEPGNLIIDFDSAFEFYASARKSLKEDKDTLKAIEYFVKAAEHGYEPRQAYSNAIVYSLIINRLDTAMTLAFKMTQAGFRDIRAMDMSYFQKLKDHSKWGHLKSAIVLNAKTYEKNLQDVSKVKLVSSDIANFWKAYDLASGETNYDSKRAIYLEHYFNKGTIGLRDFTFAKMRNGIDQFVQFVESHRPYYDGIRLASSKALQNLSNVNTYFKKIDSVIPNATFPNYYFVIGCHTSFGTVSLNGSLIGLENVIDANTPIETLPAYRQDVVSPAEFLPFVLIHELMHTYQNTSNNTLLGATIVEGGADFFTELVVGEPKPKPKYRIYGEANEKEIFREFKENLENTNHTNWIGRRDSIKKVQGWPNDLSYFIGYKIAKGYYDNSTDKKKAIQDLLDVKNPHDILKKSGYEAYIDSLK